MNSPLGTHCSHSTLTGPSPALLLMVPAFSYFRAWEQLRNKLVIAMHRVMESGILTLATKIREIGQYGIQVGIHYQHPVHLMPAYQRFGFAVGSLPNTEQACQEVMSLPMFPELEEDEIHRVVDACSSFRS